MTPRESFRRRCFLLNELALALAERGLRSRLTRPRGEGVLVLHAAGEGIECCDVGGRYVVVTQSGTVLGFADEPDLVDAVVQLGRPLGTALPRSTLLPLDREDLDDRKMPA